MLTAGLAQAAPTRTDFVTLTLQRSVPHEGILRTSVTIRPGRVQMAKNSDWLDPPGPQSQIGLFEQSWKPGTLPDLDQLLQNLLTDRQRTEQITKKVGEWQNKIYGKERAAALESSRFRSPPHATRLFLNEIEIDPNTPEYLKYWRSFERLRKLSELRPIDAVELSWDGKSQQAQMRRLAGTAPLQSQCTSQSTGPSTNLLCATAFGTVNLSAP